MRSSSQWRRFCCPLIVAGALPRVVAAALVACASALVSGCSGSMIADHLPVAVGGLPEDAPARPAADTPYPAVHSMPPARATTPLSYDQQKQLEDDLVAARTRYGANPDTPAAASGSAASGSTASASTASGSAASTSAANAKAGSARNP
jgi:hypothetical protein